MTRRRDPHSWTVVTLPERDLAEVVLEVATPLLARLGPDPSVDDARRAIELAVRFWNASVLASRRWERPRPKELAALRSSMLGPQAPRDGAETFDRLAQAFRAQWLDPRLVAEWSYDADLAGEPRLRCVMGLPDGVRAKLAPPAEQRVAIGGVFLDDVAIPLDAGTKLLFPVERHRGVLGDDGAVTVHAMMPTALQLFADGRLPPVGGGPVAVSIAGRSPISMVLTALRCGDDHLRHDVAILTFEPLRGE